jgi:tetratricopeptide (TPR) repeat protein
VALVLHEMGDLYDGLTEYDEAITCFREAMDIRRQRVEENPDDVTASTLYAATLYSMGFTLHNQDIDARALRVFDEALEIRRACLGDNAREVGDTLNIMGFLKAKSGQLDGSLQLLLEALRIRRLNGDLIKASDTYKNIGNVQREQGDGERALLSYKEALALRKEVLSDDHEKVADALIAIG